jgi:1-deoxy-D-xylulose-5-phosphate synthase
LTAEGIYQSVKELIGTAPAPAREQRRLASLADRLPHGDEQGS